MTNESRPVVLSIAGLDPSGGAEQEYVEDCPVCCRPNVVTVEVGEDGQVQVSARRE